MAATTGIATSPPSGPKSDTPAITAPKATAGWMNTVRDVTCGARR